MGITAHYCTRQQFFFTITVCRELAGDASNSVGHQCVVALNFIEYCVNEKPLIFVGSEPVPASQASKSSGSTDSDRSAQSDYHVADSMKSFQFAMFVLITEVLLLSNFL